MVLGDHVEQSGSLVSADRLRFDFTHFQPLTEDELRQVEEMVNEIILADLPVVTRVMKLDEARKLGAMALFGEKYGEEVRVVTVGDQENPYSREFCGGTHLTHTSQASQLRILSETGVASGTRRIEAVTGAAAYALSKSEKEILDAACASLKTTEDQLVRRIRAVMADMKALEKELSNLQEQNSAGLAETIANKAEVISGVSVVVAKVDVEDADTLRTTADQVRDHFSNGVVLLATETSGKLLFVAMATASAMAKGIHSGNIIRETAKASGGGGGGRPDMAQAGGKDTAKLADALAAALSTIKNQLGA
jgi:alanyl-tRNA synthetase